MEIATAWAGESETDVTKMMAQPRLRRRGTIETELFLSEDIRRGATVAAVLKNVGQVFRVHPDSLPDEEKTKLYSRSQTTDRIDAFISHSWSSPGFAKYLTLLFHETATHALGAAIVAGGLVYVLQHEVVDLPSWIVHRGFEPFFEVVQFSSPWEYLASSLAAAAVFAFYPSRITGRVYFLECVRRRLDLAIRGSIPRPLLGTFSIL
jgi:hypothetical protein